MLKGRLPNILLSYNLVKRFQANYIIIHSIKLIVYRFKTDQNKYFFI